MAVPAISLPQHGTKAIAGRRKAKLLQLRQRVRQVVEVAIVKGNANHFAGSLAAQIGLQCSHGQTQVAQRMQEAHLAPEIVRRHTQAAKPGALFRCWCNLVEGQNGNRRAALYFGSHVV